MAQQVLMPKQGNTVEACLLVQWKVAVGDTVEVGQIICEAETDKATVDVESTAAGTVLALLADIDVEVPVMEPIMIVGEAGENIDGLTGGAAASPEPASAPATAEASAPQAENSASTPVADAIPATSPAAQPGAPAPVVSEGTGFASPRARGAALERGVLLAQAQGTGPNGRILERDILAVAPSQPLTPAAQAKFAQGGWVAPATGTGLGGRITEDDLIPAGAAGSLTGATGVAAENSADAALAQTSATVANLEYPGVVNSTPVKGIRKITASRMMQSLDTTAQFTMHIAADAREVLKLRERFKALGEMDPRSVISIGDMISFAVIKTLKSYPELNAHYLGDRIDSFEDVHLGMAMDTPKGLLVPVTPFSSRMTLTQFAQVQKDLVSRARSGKVAPEELSGSTFTISNVGAMGIEYFTPVLNVPEVAILGVGGIILKPVQNKKTGEVEFIPHVHLSLTLDHQAADGAPAARFLRDLQKAIAEFSLVLAF